MEMIKLRSDVQVLARAHGIVQVGLTPGQACLLSHSDVDVVRLLDGTRSAAQIAAALPDPEAATLVLTVLEQRGLLEHHVPLTNNDPVIRAGQLRSAMAHLDIRIHGGGRLGTTIALLLAGEGIASVRVSDRRLVSATDVTPWGASRIDIGMRRDRIAAQVIERMHRGTVENHLRPRARGTTPLDVVVCDQVADWPWFNPMKMDALVAGDVPHIAVCVTQQAAAISHVVIPGRTACIRCCHHAQADADPEWPRIAEQLTRRPAIDTSSLSMVLCAATATVRRIEQWCTQQENEELLMLRADGTAFTTAVTAHHMCGCTWNSSE